MTPLAAGALISPAPDGVDGRPLDITQLRLLVNIAERGSVRSAAQALGILQPNASRALVRLERQLGLVLVNRSPTGSELTTDGVVLVQCARDVLDAVRNLRLAASALHRKELPHLTIGASLTVAEYLIPRWLGAFRERHRGVSMSLEVLNSHEICALVMAGECQVGFVESPRIPPALSKVPVGRDRLVLVVDPDHQWAEPGTTISVNELAATRLITREPGSGTRLALEEALDGMPIAPPALELPSNAAVRANAIAGFAPAVLSNLAVSDAVTAGSLMPVKVSGIESGRLLHAVWLGSRRPAEMVSDLITIARKPHVSSAHC